MIIFKIRFKITIIIAQQTTKIKENIPPNLKIQSRLWMSLNKC